MNNTFKLFSTQILNLATKDVMFHNDVRIKERAYNTIKLQHIQQFANSNLHPVAMQAD